MKGQSYFILGLVFALIIAVLAVINGDPVQFNYIFGSQQWPLILIILVSALLGGLVAFMLNLRKVMQLKSENKQLKQQLSASQQKQPEEEKA
ncbi:lipopolysaccharide assembly protein LapA domain-containing protein [Bacillus sp. 165]|uniref:LapA family protein n=1 Tax=Bacillus sp. 165 TaxID=1529117 RepID=UPI001ADB62CA|nr:lipopolysaccharide assembly protein LapA domain-containing protein [Bacillus sp. 165]MBO9130677.1 DUF1049 domain-containing protein [Bacillus sp. 165]